jgi:hypothetical protein
MRKPCRRKLGNFRRPLLGKIQGPLTTQPFRGGHRPASLRQTLGGRESRPVSGLLHHHLGHDPMSEPGIFSADHPVRLGE